MTRSIVMTMFVLVSLGGAAASAETLNVTIGKDLPDGMTVFVTVGGEGANCSGAGSGRVSGGKVTISFDFHCEPSGRPPSTAPNDKCRVSARAVDERTDTQYKGNDKLTATSVANVYQASFNLSKAVPRP